MEIAKKDDWNTLQEILFMSFLFLLFITVWVLKNLCFSNHETFSVTPENYAPEMKRTAETAIRNSCQPMESRDIGWRDVFFCKKVDGTDIFIFLSALDADTKIRSPEQIPTEKQRGNMSLVMSCPSSTYDDRPVQPLISRDRFKVFVVEIRSSFPILGVAGNYFGPVYAVKLGDLNTELLLAGLPL